MSLVPSLIIIPLASALAISLIGKRIRGIGESLSVLATLGLSFISCLLAFSLKNAGAVAYKVGGLPAPVDVTLLVDSLSALMLVTMNIVACLVAFYSWAYMKKYSGKWQFYSLFMVMVAGINGVLISGDIFNLYLFLEMAAIAGYFLVAFGVDADGLEASFKYAVMGSVASAFIIMGIAFLYSHTSTLNISEMAKVLAADGPSKILPFVTVLFLMGFGLKAALVPFHAWLPYAHSSAPAPVSAMLSGVSIKVLGIYSLARILFNVFGMTPAVSQILIILAVISMLVGSFLAFGQSDIKRLFAYSSISQIGYIALGLGVGTPLAILGGLFHLFNHSIFKSLLFLNSGAIERSCGTRDLNKMSGILSKAPITGCTNLIGALSICGVPPLGGFWSKLIIILACIQANRPGLAFIAVFVSILTLAYYFKALTPALFTRPGAGLEFKKESLMMAIPMVILAILSIASAVMLLPGAGQFLFKNAAAVLTGGTGYGNI